MKANGYGMFEEKGNRKRKKSLRILSVGLSLSLLLTGCGPMYVTPLAITGVGQMEEASQGSGNDAVAGSTEAVITGFGSLPEDVREQKVSLGTTIEELNLPDTLEAYATDEKNEWGGGKTVRRGQRRQG